jgi:hypothetical protein
MNTTVKAALAVAAAMALSGCNMVMTDHPMFTAAAGAGAPPIHPGVWRIEKHGCDFDESQPQDKWPLCSDAQGSVGEAPFWQEVAGDPVILQARFAPPGGKKSDTRYFYIAVRPLKLDADGRVIAMRSWPVRCGPPPPLKEPDRPLSPALREKPDTMTDAEWAELKANLAILQLQSEKLQVQLKQLNRTQPTKTPLPGLKMDKNTGGCRPVSVASLRNAAAASEAWAEDDSVSHWVRERGPGDKPDATPASLFSMASGGFGHKPPTQPGAP